MNFFEHEMFIFTFARQSTTLGGLADFTLNFISICGTDDSAVMGHTDTVAVF